MGQYPKALEFFEKATSDKTLIETDPRLYGRALINRTYCRHKVGSDADLEQYFRQGVCILDSIGDWQGMAKGYYNGAEYFRDRNDTAQALSHAHKAMKYALESKNNKRLLETMELLVSLDPRNASEYTRAYIKLDDSLQMEERAIRDKFARIRFETNEFIAQNELLARQRQLWIGIAGGVFLLGLSFLIIIIQRIRNQKLRFQQQQQESNQEIFNLMLSQNQKIEEGKQSEQRRISEELHDGVLGEMNGIRMVLLGLNKKADEAAVNLRAQAITKLQQVQEEIRTISHELSDASYRKLHNFVVSLQELLKTMADAAGIAHEMTYDEDIDWDTMSAEMKINLYRIVQESLQNCVKHAQAGNISLNLHGNSKNIVITISDDGRGFSPQGGKKGIGHKNISSRIKKLNGVWEISSQPGKGTTVTIKVPYIETSPDRHAREQDSGKLQEA
jgi:signal transduction histidine kinase